MEISHELLLSSKSRKASSLVHFVEGCKLCRHLQWGALNETQAFLYAGRHSRSTFSSCSWCQKVFEGLRDRFLVFDGWRESARRCVLFISPDSPAVPSVYCVDRHARVRLLDSTVRDRAQYGFFFC